MENFLDRMRAYLKNHTLQFLLILGLIHGLIYVAIIPPWWNYDEAGHFEYVWLVAHRPAWPKVGDYDNAMRLQMGEASLSYGVASTFNFDESKRFDDPIYIGIPQVGDLPVYYWLAALPLRLMRNVNILFQMYTVRVLSVGLLVFTLFCAWKFVEELFPQNRTLPWMVTFFLALLPGFVNVMASINNDAAGAAASGLYLWFSARIIKRGFSIPSLLGWCAAIGLCLFTRDITRLLLVTAPLVLWARVSNVRLFLAPLIAGMVIGAAIIPFAVTKQDAQYWFHSPAGASADRIESPKAPFGKYALVYDGTYSDFGQALPLALIGSLRDQPLTLGVWVWADEPVSAQSPVIQFIFPYYMPQQYIAQTIAINTEPTFYSVQVRVPPAAQNILIRISPRIQTTRVYFDGWVLAEGQFSNTPPVFADDALSRGTWDGQAFKNLLRNASAEQTWFNATAWIDQKSLNVPFVRGRVSLMLASLQDQRAFGWYYRQTASQLVQTFWGKPAAAQVSLPGIYTYDVLQILLALAMIGLMILAYRSRPWPWQTLIFILFVVALIWDVTGLRGSTEVLGMGTVPWARYGLPAFIPTALLLCAGWKQLLDLCETYLNQPGLGARLFSAFMIGFALFVAFTAGAHFFRAVLAIQQLVLLFALTVMSLFILEKMVQK